MIQYNWLISQLDTAPSEDGLTDVVKTVHWTCQATEMTDDKTYQTYFYGAMACATPSETDFIAYPDLTEDQVISWVKASIDIAGVEDSLVQQIEQQKIPPIVNLPLPWAE